MIHICAENVYLVLADNEIKEYLLDKSPWHIYVASDLDYFINYCITELKATSNLTYFNLLTLLKNDLSGEELVELSQFSVNSAFMLKKLCQYYIENENKNDAIALLSADIWTSLTYQGE